MWDCIHICEARHRRSAGSQSVSGLETAAHEAANMNDLKPGGMITHQAARVCPLPRRPQGGSHECYCVKTSTLTPLPSCDMDPKGLETGDL